MRESTRHLNWMDVSQHRTEFNIADVYDNEDFGNNSGHDLPSQVNALIVADSPLVSQGQEYAGGSLVGDQDPIPLQEEHDQHLQAMVHLKH